MSQFLDFRKRTHASLLLAAILAFMLAAIGVVGLVEVGRAADTYQKLDTLGASYIKEAKIDLTHIAGNWRRALTSSDENARKIALSDMHQNAVSLRNHIEMARHYITSDASRIPFSDLDRAYRLWSENHLQAERHLRKKPLNEMPEDLLVTLQSFNSASSVLDNALDHLLGNNQRNLKKLIEIENGHYKTFNLLVMGFFYVSIALAGVGGFVLLQLSVIRRNTAQ